MPTPHLDSALNSVKSDYFSVVHNLTKIAPIVSDEPDLILSHVLFGLIGLGSNSETKKGVPAALALEFLDQALKLGDGTGYLSTDGENNLLITDFLYAQAIDQVIGLRKPVVIKILARAIMDTAVDRSRGDFDDHRKQLLTAALRMGSYLWEIEGDKGDAIARAAEACRAGEVGPWVRYLPASYAREFLNGSEISTVTS